MSSSWWASTSCAEKRGGGTCLKSLCVYCPTLSGGEEERAMDNILFFYPLHLHENAQMNHVGFCIGATCLVERFGATGLLDRIQTSHGTTVLCCPFPNLWIAVETMPAYDSSALLPVVRRGFEVFVLRYGWSTVAALVSPVGGSVDVAEPRRVLKRFFEKFAVFLETSVLLTDVCDAVRMARNARPSSAASVAASGAAVGQERSHMQRWKHWWAVLSVTESLLAFPVFMRPASIAAQSMCHSLVYRYLSFLLPKGVSGPCAGCSRNNNGNSYNRNHFDGCFSDQASCTVGWGEEYKGVAFTSSAATLTQDTTERLLWTCCQYVIFVGETLKVIASNATPAVVSKLICLLLVDPDVTDFAAFLESGRSHCYICHSSGIIVAIFVNTSLYRSMHQIILEICKPLAADIAEFLTTERCPLSREGLVRPHEVHQMAMSLLNPSHSSGAGFFAPVSHLPRLREMNLTLQWTVWHNEMIVGTSMREYPRALQVLLSSMLRRLTSGVSTKLEGVNGSCDVACANSHHGRFSRALEGGNVFSSDMLLPSAVTEVWMPLPGSTWMCVSRRHHHVGGVVFYNSAPLKRCCEAASELFEYMPFLL
ncbi:hypothetical protein TraAM80_02122 [Trypanosoma rangeli]|uniref:CCZ1/INTU/HSP4 first Longin domain-containing protein n=1 Tax=Trypanosoma rangeli TaxID=5698 RepID=A0A3S5IS06_TRYRA|nr:uncharacterized protein TraAM80_02122 [Trypanosoma rangeli]RNF09513.1 hypothetical protein TraAM80_02122 [Trypanosoma rangeli]|eukprot:RNF09513.1 hypothetical protein TraAM80_02122 [Trypanosoma rangeli]